MKLKVLLLLYAKLFLKIAEVEQCRVPTTLVLVTLI